MEDQLQVTSDQLLTEIGRLTVANGVLRGQLVASRQEVLRLNQHLAAQAEPASDEPTDS